MKKEEYAKLAFSYKEDSNIKANFINTCLHKHWVLSAFAVTYEGPEEYKKEPYIHRLVRNATGVYFIDSDKELVRIDDASVNDPLFSFSDPILIDNTWSPNVKETINTTIGRLFINQVLLADVFYDKILYTNATFSVPAIEDIISKTLTSTPEDVSTKKKDRIYIDEYIKFVDRLQYIVMFASLCNYSATPKNIVAPPGISEFREQLIKKYGDSLNDIATFANFEKELKEYANEYLKDDPSNDVFLSGRAKDNGYRRMFLDFGVDTQLRKNKKIPPIIKPLSEGWSTDKESYKNMINGIRAGSYSRGLETVNGGITAKALLRSLGSYTISYKDCQSTMGLTKIFTTSDYKKLVGRYVLDKNKWQLIEDEESAKSYIDKEITIRSPMYCKSPEGSFCHICLGKNLSLNPNGLSLAATDVSSVILNTSLKAMHGKVLSLATFDYSRHIT